TSFSRMQCSIKKRRLKGEIILNNHGEIFRSLYDSSRKLIKMHEFSRK
ncbi:2576_t:CDS:1, partial [Gigaspora margarita]